MPSHKTLKIKKVLAKKQKQNRWVLVETLTIVGGYTDILNEWGRAVIKNCILNSQFVVQAHPAVDPNANGQHDPLQRQKASLEKNQAQALNPSNVPLRPFRHRDIDGEVTKRGNMASVYRLSEARINELPWLIRYAGENGRRWRPQRNCFCFLSLRILCQIIESYIIFVPSYFFDKTFV